jgi:uncharacterized YceG family protein
MNFISDNSSLKKYLGVTLLLVVTVIAIPFIFKYELQAEDNPVPPTVNQFPVTVDFSKKTIKSDPAVESMLESKGSPFQASAILSWVTFQKVFSYVAIVISHIGGDSNLALVGGNKFITIPPGLRKEEVVSIFSKELDWTDVEKKEFTKPDASSSLPLFEGSYFPGTYAVSPDAKPEDVQQMINNRFTRNILSHYGTSTEEKVSLDMALKVASLIQRETIGTEDMRLVSGIIWNRIFNDMNLQLDATLQYAKANLKKTPVWWPEVVPNDKYLKSPYNTYLHEGLPPTPIANPSVAAVIAALNPIKTDCLFYFHDKKGDMHCSITYEEHVKLLKKYYGRGE